MLDAVTLSKRGDLTCEQGFPILGGLKGNPQDIKETGMAREFPWENPGSNDLSLMNGLGPLEETDFTTLPLNFSQLHVTKFSLLSRIGL